MPRDWLIAALCLVTCYLLGGIPFALVFGRLFYGIDIRQHGSGNLGATNTFRVLGTVPGIFVLILDASKGAIGVAAAAALLAVTAAERTFSPEWFLLLAAFAVMAGHVYSPYLRFKGGKGVAAAAGALLVVMPLPILLLTAIFVVTVALSRMVSLASVLVAVLFPFAGAAFHSRHPAAIGLMILASALVIWRHRSNISRIIKGVEPRITDKPSGETR